jgi:hypothetical protein
VDDGDAYACFCVFQWKFFQRGPKQFALSLSRVLYSHALTVSQHESTLSYVLDEELLEAVFATYRLCVSLLTNASLELTFVVEIYSTVLAYMNTPAR